MSQSCFSLGFLSQNSLCKLSTFHGYKDIYSRVYEGCEKSVFINKAFWRLNLTTGMSRESEQWANCLARLEFLSRSVLAIMTLQLPCMLHTCATLATCQSRVSCEIQSWDSFDCTHLEFSSHSLTHNLYINLT